MYSHSDSLCLIPFFNAVGLTEVEKNYSDDTLACDDDTHKAVLS